MRRLERCAAALTLALAFSSAAADAKKGWKPIFNGKDLAGWETFLSYQPEQGNDAVIGVGKDPDRVFSVVDGAIRISGKQWGALTSQGEFENYRLRLEFKWGELQWAPRATGKRDSGVLYHAVGPHGAQSGHWMRSLEMQVQEGDCGDYHSLDGANVDVEAVKPGEDLQYKPGAPVVASVKQRVLHSEDAEKPKGQWNVLEIVLRGDSVEHIVNGTVVFRGTHSKQTVDGKVVPLTRGKIQLQSEGAEVFYRNIEVQPLDAGAGGVLLVANKGDHTMTVIDPETGTLLATVAESGVTAHEVAASPDGRTAYLPIYGNAGVGKPGTDGRTIDVVDVASGKHLSTIDLGRAERPHAPHFGPDGRLYVTTELSKTVTVIDPKTNTVVDRIPTGSAESHMVALTRDGKRAFTSNVGPGTVSVLDVPGKKVLKVIDVVPHAQRIALSIDDRWAFTADQTKPRLAVIDTAAMTVARWVDLPGIGFGTAPTPDGKTLVIAIVGANKVAFLDLATMKVTATVDVPGTPQEVLVRPDGRYAYVSCDTSAQVAVIDLAAQKVETLLAAGTVADGLAWAVRP